jgi:hypothetical protein
MLITNKILQDASLSLELLNNRKKNKPNNHNLMLDLNLITYNRSSSKIHRIGTMSSRYMVRLIQDKMSSCDQAKQSIFMVDSTAMIINKLTPTITTKKTLVMKIRTTIIRMRDLRREPITKQMISTRPIRMIKTTIMTQIRMLFRPLKTLMKLYLTCQTKERTDTRVPMMEMRKTYTWT